MNSRRLEELALNASGGFDSLVYDGWLLGYRPGPTKRLRCVNAFYPGCLPTEQKIERCVGFYAAVGLPALFRMLPFSQPAELDSLLDTRGWAPFERTLVQSVDLAEMRMPAMADAAVEFLAVPQWVEATATLLEVDAGALPRLVGRAQSYPLPQAGALIRRDGEVLACGLLKLEDQAVGLFALATLPSARGKGLGRAIVAALLSEARRRGALHAYLQVTASNVPALAIYRAFGFSTVHEYWYRSPAGEQR